MSKRFWSLVLSMALIGSVFAAVPALAQEAEPVAIPAAVQIDDPVGDANGVNDQDNAYNVPPLVGEGDHVGPAGGTATDILKVWFANTASDIALNIQVNGNPSTLAYDTYFRFSSNAGEGPVAADTTRGCLQWIASVNGAAGAYNGATEGNLTDKCNVGTPVVGPLTIAPAETGFVITLTFPRSYSPLLADGSTLTAPFGVSRILYADGLPPSPAAGSTAAFVTLDNTKRGTDYAITSGGSGPVVKDPGTPSTPKPSKPVTGKDCGKGKSKGGGKGPKKCPKPKPPVSKSCPAYVPGEEGAEAETTVVTDAATAEKPVVVELDSEAGLGAMPIGGTPVPYDETYHFFQNVQVDTAGSETGLYARLDFAEFRDYDLYLNFPDGTEADHSGDFNAVAGELGCGGTSCDSSASHEAILGLRTADCGGWTAEMVSFLSEGGPVTLSLWLGDILADPAAPAEVQQAAEAQSAADMFFGALKMRNPMAADSSQASSTPAASKGCTKGKGKKNGCKKPPVACAPYAPGEMGAEQPTVVVNDSHTAEAPLLQPITLDAAVDEGILEAVGAGETPRAVFNVQVDSALQSAGLYVTFEFDSHRDYDLYGYFPDGSVAASSHGFQPAMETNDLPDDVDLSNTDSNHGGESTATSENLIGIITPDCGGYTLEFSSYFAEGGDFEIKLWLGEGVTAAGAPE